LRTVSASIVADLVRSTHGVVVTEVFDVDVLVENRGEVGCFPVHSL